MNSCPRCGESFHYPWKVDGTTYGTEFSCGTRIHAAKGTVFPSDRCRLNVAERRLAAAKVLAEAVENWEEVCLPPKIAAALAAFNETMKE